MTSAAIEGFLAKREADREFMHDLGIDAGRLWAKATATTGQLRALVEWRDLVAPDWGSVGGLILDVEMPSDTYYAQEIWLTIAPGSDDSHGAAKSLFGEFVDEPVFIAGWVDGAVEVWDEA